MEEGGEGGEGIGVARRVFLRVCCIQRPRTSEWKHISSRRSSLFATSDIGPTVNSDPLLKCLRFTPSSSPSFFPTVARAHTLQSARRWQCVADLEIAESLSRGSAKP